MRVCRVPFEVLILLLLSSLLWKTADTGHTLRLKSGVAKERDVEANKSSEKVSKESDHRKAVTEEEISYIGSTLQPRECLSLLYLLHHVYKRRRRREISIKSKNQARSAQITPCETMLLNYWRDPRSRIEKDRSYVSRTLRQVDRQDLARWLCGRRPSCSGRSMTMNGTNYASPLTAQMQVIPICSGRAAADRTSTETTSDSMIWMYIALAVCGTATLLFCVHYLFKRFRRSAKYIALNDTDLRNIQYTRGCIDKRSSLSSCNEKKMRQPLQPPCACSGN